MASISYFGWFWIKGNKIMSFESQLRGAENTKAQKQGWLRVHGRSDAYELAGGLEVPVAAGPVSTSSVTVEKAPAAKPAKPSKKK